MTMRLASEEVTILIGSASVELVPSLRAATRLARRYDGFTAVFRGVLDGNVTIMADLIREGASHDTDLPDLLDEIGLRGLGATLDQLTEPLAQFVLALIGHDPDTPAGKSDIMSDSPGKLIPFADYHRQLYKLATGALGWCPADAWAATPAEILAAYEGRADLLKAIFGTAEEDDVKPATYAEPQFNPDGTDPEFDRAGFERLRAIARGAL
jgi:hypothetical protein